MDNHGDLDRIASWYRRFAEMEAFDVSPLYAELATGVATDAQLLTLLGGLPRPKQQPNLLFASARFVAGTPSGFAEFRDQVWSNRDRVIDTMMTRFTQTNEVARTASVFALLARLPQPLALLEVGASAGLCLLPDRYRYDFGYATAGDQSSDLTIACEVDGAARPDPGHIEVAWRVGLDRNPLDVSNQDDVAWLETLVWPEHHGRLARLRRAIDIVRKDPPRIVAGDLLADFDDVAADAPTGATLVVLHSATLPYVPSYVREAFVAKMTTMDGHWIAQEEATLIPHVIEKVARLTNGRPPRGGATLTVTADGAPKALAAPHGGWLHWLSEDV